MFHYNFYAISECSCQNTRKFVYMKPDSPNYRMSVSWVEPKPNCPGQKINQTTTNPPNVKPGASFGIGVHSVWYSYLMSSGVRVQCSANIEVKGICYKYVPYCSLGCYVPRVETWVLPLGRKVGGGGAWDYYARQKGVALVLPDE